MVLPYKIRFHQKIYNKVLNALYKNTQAYSLKQKKKILCALESLRYFWDQQTRTRRCSFLILELCNEI